MNKKHINIALVSLLFCTVNNNINGTTDVEALAIRTPQITKAVLLKGSVELIKDLTKKSDPKPLILILKFASEAAYINVGSSCFNVLFAKNNNENLKNCVVSLAVVGIGRLLDKTPARIVGKKYDEFFNSKLDGRFKPVGNLLKDIAKSICVNFFVE